MEQLVKTLKEQINENRLMDTAKSISTFHRIQASTGFRAAARHCVARLTDKGIDARIIGYPADGEHRSRLARTLMEWDIRGGGCVIEGFGEIADYSKVPISVLPRSAGCDFKETPLEVVYLDKSSRMEDYAGWDLKGKLVFVRENHADFVWAMEKMGAAGVITDYVLHPDTQQDVIRYTSFWWKEIPGEVRYFGFCMSPARGKRFAEFCLQKREKGEAVLATGHVDASFYPGHLDVVEATLPGGSREEILLIAHLCHPQTSANDNCSGVAASMEALIVLSRLIQEGKLAPLKRTVKVLLVPEMNGTWAYLGDPGFDKALAALNLDMVGARQEEGYGPLTISALPLSTPSFTEYAAMLALELSANGYTGFGGEGIPAVNTTVTGFATGSDHYIITDPTVGVPCTMLGQWPDKFYHTSGDTFDRLSPRVLSTSCATAAAFAYSLANLDVSGLGQLLDYGKARLAGLLAKEARRESVNPAQMERLHEAAALAAADAARFFPGGEADGLLKEGGAQLEHIAAAMIPAGAAASPDSGDARVLKRQYQGPVQDLDRAISPKEGEKLPSMGGSAGALTQYYIDGKRTYGRIVQLVTMDTGCKPEDVTQRLDILIEAGLVTVE